MTRVKRGKNIFKSKTFWLNVLSGAGMIASGQLGIQVPAQVAVPVLAGVNIANRFLTDEPVRLPSVPSAP